MQLLNKILSRPLISLSILVFIAFAIRLLTIYHGISAHPDERHIMMSVMNMNWGWYEMNPGSFAYGSVPFYLLFFVIFVSSLIISCFCLPSYRQRIYHKKRLSERFHIEPCAMIVTGV